MIPWNKTETRTLQEAHFNIGSADLSVKERSDGDRQWQLLTLTVGEFTEAPFEECIETWPRRAVQVARQAISELDRRLKAIDE